MLPIKAWRIIYADGSEFTSEDGTWAEAPPFGVQAVVYYHVDPKYLTVDGGKNSPNKNIGGNEGDLYAFQGDNAHPDYQGIKMGLWMDRDGYYRIADLASQRHHPEVD